MSVLYSLTVLLKTQLKTVEEAVASLVNSLLVDEKDRQDC